MNRLASGLTGACVVGRVLRLGSVRLSCSGLDEGEPGPRSGWRVEEEREGGSGRSIVGEVGT